MPPSGLSDPLVLGFILMSVGLAAMFVWGVSAAWRRSGMPEVLTRRAASTAALGAAAWMAVTDMTARSGALRHWDARPPRFGILVLAIVAIAIALAFGPVGRRLAALPLWVLIGVQAFRWPLELMMHRAYVRGVMPVQMSYSGRNFDIVTGVTAVIVAVLLATRFGGRRLAWIWNVAGFALLLNILTIAVLSTPLVAYFGERRLNIWIAYPPFVWLPAVMVLVAMTGHLLIFRRLASPATAAEE